MIKFSTILLIIFISLSVSACKNSQQLERNCAAVMDGLDQCFEQRSGSSSCVSVVDEFRQKLTKIPINDFNLSMWASTCKTQCLTSNENATFMHDYFESKCVESEVVTLKDDRLFKLLGMTLLLLFSSLILYFTIRSVKRARQFRKDAIKVKGIVIDHDTVFRSGSTLYSPIIEFRDRLGSLHTLTSSVYSSSMSKPSEPVGSDVTVIYPKNKPEEACFDSFMRFWLIPLFLFVFSGAFFIVSANGLFSSKSWAVHQQYLKQHMPSIAEATNDAVHTIRRSALIFNSVTGVRVIDEKSDSITLELDYRLSPFIADDVYLGAITMTDGYSGGEWGYRPGRAQSGAGTVKVQLNLSSSGPDAYCSNEIQLSMYYSGEPSFYKRVIPYEKCWSRK